jgi:hypothetical protein
MVTVEVTGGGTEPPPLEPPPPPQPEINPSPARAPVISNTNCSLRRLHPKMKNRAASAATGKNGRELGCKVEDSALTEIVSWVVAAAPEGVTGAGLKEQVAPVGNPEQAKLTAELNPFCGVTVKVTVPWLPLLTESDVGEAPSVKEGGEGAAGVTVSATVVVSAVLPLAPVMVMA